MQSDSEVKKNNDRRKRINRIKIAIIVIVIFLLIVPTIFCVILGIQVSRLQKQVSELAATHGINHMSEDNTDEKYVYAAVKSSKKPNQETIVTLTPAPKEDALITQKPTNTEEDIAVNTDSAGNKKDNKEDKKTSKGIYAGKKVYLTFDDGPSIFTDEILDVLAEYNIKATFFVIGKTDKKSKKSYQRIVEEGHTLGMHSYSHKYDKIYNSVEDFDKDFTKLWKLLYDTTGYKPSIYRFPGGSDNLVNQNGMDDFIKYLNDKSVVYFDWNVLNGDATNIDYNEDQLVDNVLNGVVKKDRAIVLMHDTQAKKLTVDSLPEMIEALIAGGAQILPLDEEVAPIQMIKAETIK